MKIGILTFHYSKHNYGAVLQTYASYNILKKLGFEPKIINLLPKKGSSLKSKIKSIINGSNKFDKFRKKYLELTRELYSYEDLTHINRDFEVFFVGSDQIWRPSMAKNLLTHYFLDFAENQKKKVAYAASFGIEKWEGDEEQKQTFTYFLKRFDAISVREDSGVKICKDEFNVVAEHVLDPTLLLSQQDYQHIESKKFNYKLKNTNYVAYYLLEDNKGLGEIPKLIAKQLNVTSINLFGRNIRLFGKSIIHYVTVGRWLSCIKNSSFVITDSFHCVIFSIIYRRNFVCLLNKSRGTSRIISLLHNLGLEDRYCEKKDIDFTKFLHTINYDMVYGKLDKKKIDSYRFLKNAIIN